MNIIQLWTYDEVYIIYTNMDLYKYLHHYNKGNIFFFYGYG